MLEIKLIDDRSSLLTSLLAPPAKDPGSFTGVLEELIGADTQSENEIDSRSEANSPKDIPESTPTDSLTPEIPAQSTCESFLYNALPDVRHLVSKFASGNEEIGGRSPMDFGVT